MSPMALQSCAACVSLPAWYSTSTWSSAGIALATNALASELMGWVFWLLRLMSATHPANASTQATRMRGTMRLRQDQFFLSRVATAAGGDASGGGRSGRPVDAPQNGHVPR